MREDKIILDFSSFENSLSQLKKHYGLALNENDIEIKFAFKTATIQSFEYVYEIAIKMTKRILKNNLISESEINIMSFKDIIRKAAQFNLIDKPENWFSYREKRNITSHAYDFDKSELIFQDIENFIKDSQNLLEKLKDAVS
jgi:nucleotidyltransferase substrate binding protein (TIGR01987 family)